MITFYDATSARFSTRRMRYVAGFLFTWTMLLFFSSTLEAQKLEVQANLQAALYKKILALATKGTGLKPQVLVVFDNRNTDDIMAVSKAMEDLGLAIITAKNGQIPSSFGGIRAAFLSTPDDKMLAACQANGVITFSGYRELVRDGKASIAIVNEGGKPKPMIHKARLTAEKPELLAQLAAVSLIVE
jgi:hypothetical protein